jgi:hypothetical protein
MSHGIGNVGVAELFEDARVGFVRHAGARVIDDEGQVRRPAGAVPPFDRDVDAAGLGELDRIAGQVEQNLLQPAFVGPMLGYVGLTIFAVACIRTKAKTEVTTTVSH